MLHLASLLFAILFGWVHWQGGLFAEPLSMLRDGDFAAEGYALFGLLAVIGLTMIIRLFQIQRYFEAVTFISIFAALVFVVWTPSEGEWHLFVSLILLATLFLFYAVVLHFEESWFFFVHLFAPAGIARTIQFSSFGAWQKSFILYFVVLMNIHYAFLAKHRETDTSASNFEPYYFRGPLEHLLRDIPVPERRDSD